jgi:hypothetical protein
VGSRRRRTLGLGWGGAMFERLKRCWKLENR